MEARRLGAKQRLKLLQLNPSQISTDAFSNRSPRQFTVAGMRGMKASAAPQHLATHLSGPEVLLAGGGVAVRGWS